MGLGITELLFVGLVLLPVFLLLPVYVAYRFGYRRGLLEGELGERRRREAMREQVLQRPRQQQQ